VKRPALEPEPQPGQLYEWDTDPPQLYLIVGLKKKHRNIWLMRAVDMSTGCETEIGVRRHDMINGFNGWTVVS
jgi:hypothetical protein